MKVRDLMAKDLFTIRADKTSLVVKEVMSWANIRHVPVVDEQGGLVGMITHRDILGASISSIPPTVPTMEKRQHLWTVPLSQIMTTRVRTIAPDASVQEAAHEMRIHKIGCLPVIEDGRLVGIITEADLLELVERMTLPAAV